MHWYLELVVDTGLHCPKSLLREWRIYSSQCRGCPLRDRLSPLWELPLLKSATLPEVTASQGSASPISPGVQRSGSLLAWTGWCQPQGSSWDQGLVITALQPNFSPARLSSWKCPTFPTNILHKIPEPILHQGLSSMYVKALDKL